jgi:hypothetical protein
MPSKPARLPGALLLAGLLVASLLATPAPAPAAEEYGAVRSVVKVEGSESFEARVYSDSAQGVFLVLLPGEPYLYRVDRRTENRWRAVESFPRASGMLKGGRLRLFDGVPGRVVQGGLFAEVEGGFAFNALSGKRVVVAPSVPLRETR